MKETKEYYNRDTIGQLYNLPGGGVIGLLVGDQLHPPMVDDENIWKDGSRWKEGALKEFHRVLRKGGKLAFDDWMVTGRTNTKEYEKLLRMWHSPSFGTANEYLHLMENAGFEIVRFKDVSYIGRTLMPEYFESVFEGYFRAKIENSIPNYGSSVADTIKNDILFTIDLYEKRKFAYCRIVARKQT